MIIRPWHWRHHKSGTISLCMIMKNEAKRLPRCLKSLEGLVDEVIAVDTGSDDKSSDIVLGFGGRVLRRKWDDDFSKARNAGLDIATGDWILIVDPDEVIAKKDHHDIRTYAADYRYQAYRFTTRNYNNVTIGQGFRPNPNDYEEGKGWAGFSPSTKVRLFLNGLDLKFRGTWHELVDWDLDRRQMSIVNVKTPVHHYAGEIAQGSAKEKAEFYYRIALKKVKEWPTNPQAWWELAVPQLALGKVKEATYSISRSLRNSPPVASRLFEMAGCLRQLKTPELANLAFEKAICLIYPSLTHFDAEKRKLDDLIC